MLKCNTRVEKRITSNLNFKMEVHHLRHSVHTVRYMQLDPSPLLKIKSNGESHWYADISDLNIEDSG